MKPAIDNNSRPVTRKMVLCRQSGVTMIETLIAVVVLVIGVLTTMSLFSVAILQNWNQGDRATRVTEYGQDKMEQLLALSFGDGASNTAVNPTAATGGTGLGGVMAASTTVGGVTPGTPVASYVDYIDNTGTVQATNSNAVFIRQWSIATGTGTNGQSLKTITVRTSAVTALAPAGGAPSTLLVAMKTQ